MFTGSAATPGAENVSRVVSPSAPIVETRWSAPIWAPVLPMRCTYTSWSLGAKLASVASHAARYSDVPALNEICG